MSDAIDRTRSYELFTEVAELDAASRERRLRELEREDTALASEIRTLLAADAEAESVLGVFGLPPVPASVDGIEPGQQVGAFTVQREIGRGGMGVVYVASDGRLGRRVALKVLPPGRAGSDRARERLLQEARTIAALEHPNVATIYEVGEAQGGHLFIAMAYLDGETLRERIRRGRLPLADALRIAREVAMALEAAHRAGVVHRDVKPENVMLTARGAQVIDFGIARFTGGGFTGSRGTLAYLPPECLEGLPGDDAVDRWAVGVVLYEMITGANPFRAGTGFETRDRILRLAVPPLDEAVSEVPVGCARLVRRLLSADPRQRFASTSELVEALGATLAMVGEKRTAGVPPARTRFVGREQELWQVAAMLRQTRLLTLTGTGGTGKTRLACELATRARPQYPGGVFFVPLAPLAASEEVPSAITGALGVPEIHGMPFEERLAAALGGDPSLLVLDNFEHVLEAATLVPRLLDAVPSLTILVTSRAALRVGGELEFAVPPMSQPAAAVALEQLLRFEAVALFVDRAGEIRAGFELDERNGPAVAEICRRLDGLPLAIELAAARTRVLSPEEILARLSDRFALLSGGQRDAPSRHRTLREAIAWSYDLLGDDEQQLFRRFAVFAGGCTLEAATAVAGLDEFGLLDALSALVDHSLVTRHDLPDQPGRFSMLETIRDYATERLVDAGEEAAARGAHLEHFAALVDRLAPELRGGDQARALAALDLEHANLRAALDEARKDPALEVQLTTALSTFWLTRGYLAEGRERVATVLRHTGLDARERAGLLSVAGTYAHNVGDYGEARARLEAARELYMQIGETRSEADALNHLGWVAWRVSDFARATELSNEAFQIHRRLGNESGMAASLNNLGWTAQYRGELSQAVTHLEEALALRRGLENRRAIAFAEANLGAALGRAGRYDEAEDLLDSAIAGFNELGDRQLLAFSSALLARLRWDTGDPAACIKLLEDESIPTFRAIGDRWGLAMAQAVLGTCLARVGDRRHAGGLLRESLSLRRKSDDRFGEADALARIGELERLQGDHPRMARHFRDALAILTAIGSRDGVPDILESLALTYHGMGKISSAVVLCGAADRLRSETGGARPPVQREQLTDVEAAVSSTAESPAFTEDADLAIPELQPHLVPR